MTRRGITPVIAVVLLLMMTVAAAGAAFFWITTIQSRIQGQIGTQATESAAQNRQIQIIGIECSSTSPNYVNVTLQNVGALQIDAGATAITVTDNQGKIVTTNVSTMDLLPVDSIAIIQFVTIGFSTNGTYGIKITIPGGAEQTDVCIPR